MEANDTTPGVMMLMNPLGSDRRSQRWAFLSGSGLTRKGGDLAGVAGGQDQEEGRKEGDQAMARAESRVDLVSDCRDRSQAAWLHFPHIELLFLFFAFEGAVASEVAALRDSRCPWVIIVAATALVSLLVSLPRGHRVKSTHDA